MQLLTTYFIFSNYIFYFCLAKIEIVQKIANWRLQSCQLATLELPIGNSNWNLLYFGKSKVANWQLFEQFQFWHDKSIKLLFDIIWKYLILCFLYSWEEKDKTIYLSYLLKRLVYCCYFRINVFNVPFQKSIFAFFSFFLCIFWHMFTLFLSQILFYGNALIKL